MSAAISLKGPWSVAEIGSFLDATRFPMRLACTGADGFPRVASLWFHYDGIHILAVTHQKSPLARLLEKHPKVGFEVSPNDPPYYGVRGQGTAQLSPLGDSDLLDRLISNYLGDSDHSLGRWLLSRRDEELLVSITPGRFYSWDYRERMADAVSAADGVNT